MQSYLDTEGLSDEERQQTERLICLYLLVLGRPPDRDGLSAFLRHLRHGMGVRDVAAAFLASLEFQERAGGRDPLQVLVKHLAGSDLEIDSDTASIVAALVDQPAIRERFLALPEQDPTGKSFSAANYRKWLARWPEPPPVPALRPLVSFVVLVTAGDPAALAATLGSIRRSWPDTEVLLVTPWRLWAAVAWDHRAAPDVRVLPTFAGGHGARSFNRALARCRGDFVALVGERDQPHPVPRLAAALDGADAVLLDGDRLDAEKRRTAPWFGAAWDPERVVGSGFEGLAFLRTAVLRSAGGVAEGDAADTASLLLFLVRTAGEAGVRHLSAIGISRPADTPAPATARLPAVRRFLQATRPGSMPQVREGVIRVDHPLREPPPGVVVIVPTRNRAELLRRCTDGLLANTDYPALSVLIVDNGSTEPDACDLLDRLGEDRRVRVIRRPGPFNWSQLNNDAVAATTEPVLLLLNNDIEVLEPGWLRAMVGLACRPDVGAVGARLLYPTGSIQHAGVTMTASGHAIHAWHGLGRDHPTAAADMAVTHRVAAVTGACLAIRRDVFLAVGGCDAANLPVTWNDVDLCFRVREHGLQVLWTPEASLLHVEQATRGSDDTPENDARFRREQAYMKRRWGAAVREDPFWNPNLRPDGPGATLAIPPVLRVSVAGWQAGTPDVNATS